MGADGYFFKKQTRRLSKRNHAAATRPYGMINDYEYTISGSVHYLDAVFCMLSCSERGGGGSIQNDVDGGAMNDDDDDGDHDDAHVWVTSARVKRSTPRRPASGSPAGGITVWRIHLLFERPCAARGPWSRPCGPGLVASLGGKDGWAFPPAFPSSQPPGALKILFVCLQA